MSTRTDMPTSGGSAGDCIGHACTFPEMATIAVGSGPRAQPGRMSDYEVVIVGGGPAGLSAAIVLARARRSVAVVDAGSPRNKPAAHMQGYLSRDGVAPQQLLAFGRAE